MLIQENQKINLFKINEDDFSLILYCLLNRIPILISGSTKQNVEFFANKLADLMVFRNKLIFYTDFVSKDELKLILDEEESNYDVQRSIIICPNEGLHKAMQLFDSFNSWILCFNQDLDSEGKQSKDHQFKLPMLMKAILDKINIFLYISNSQKVINVEIKSVKQAELDLRFERMIYRKAIKFVDDSISKMSRIFSQNLRKSANFDQDLMEELLDFSFEESNLKKNFFKIQILQFYNATRRAFSLLNKLDLLNSLDLAFNLNKQTLTETISYADASTERLLEFIKHEWNTDFSSYVDKNRAKYKDDLVESLWG